MQRFGKLADQSLSSLPETADDFTAGGGEYVIWRHQDLTQRSEGSKVASGVDPTGTDFETTDYAVQATREPDDEQTIFRAQVAPAVGDLIITLYGRPDTKHEAFEAEAAAFYRVTNTDEHRQDGKLVLCRIYAEKDQHRDHSK